MTFTKKELITPERAGELLQNNRINRSISMKLVEKYANDKRFKEDNANGQ